jgi:hypothetical protein
MPPASRTRRATAATGWMIPVSLLANITATSAGLAASPSAWSSAARSITPARVTGAIRAPGQARGAWS